MSANKKATKFIIILILFVFLVITVLSAIVPYIGGTQTDTTSTGDVLSGDTTIQTGAIIQTGVTSTGTN